MTRVGAALRSGATELRRTPLLLALFVVAPAYVIYVFTLVAPAAPAVVRMDGTTVRTSLADAFPAFTTPMTAALLAGIAGLFLMRTAAAADARLVVAGYRPRQVILARLGLVAGIAGIATAVAVGVMLTAFEPADVAWFVLGTWLTALVYGMVGVLAGVVLTRLSGVYVILFGSMIDLFVFQNPLATDPPALARLLPGHYPLKVAMKAAFTGDFAADAFGWGMAYLGVVTLAAAVAFAYQLRVD